MKKLAFLFPLLVACGPEAPGQTNYTCESISEIVAVECCANMTCDKKDYPAIILEECYEKFSEDTERLQEFGVCMEKACTKFVVGPAVYNQYSICRYDFVKDL